MLWLFLIACQEPFGADRHDLVGYRIAAVEVALDGEVARPRAALVSEGRLWSDLPPQLGWYLLDDADAIADSGTVPDAISPSPTLSLGTARVLGLRATWPDGTERLATLDLRGIARTGIRPEAIQAQPLPVDLGEEALELGLEARRELVAEEGPLPTGGLLRLTPERVGGGDTVRWMATTGTFLELDDHVTDWAHGQLALEDGLVEDWAPASPGVVSFLALSLGAGAGRFRAADLWMGPADEPGTWVAGRWLPGEALVGPTWVTLSADDDAPSGLRIAGTVATPAEPPPGPCAAEGQALDLDVVLTGACARQELVGVPLLVEPDP